MTIALLGLFTGKQKIMCYVHVAVIFLFQLIFVFS